MLFKEPIIGSLQSKMSEICHLENRHDVIFSAEGGPIWIKFRRLVQNDMSIVAVVEIETRCRIPIWRIQWHVIPEPCITLQGEFTVTILEPHAILQGAVTWRIQCHDSRATCHIAGCCHHANSVACHLRAMYHIARCCQLVNSLSQFQSHMPHCRVQSPGEINVMIMPHCRV